MAEWKFLPESLQRLFYNPVTGKITLLHEITDFSLVLIPLTIVLLLWWWIHSKTKDMKD